MPKKPKNQPKEPLYPQGAENIKFGTVSGSHVAHIIGVRNSNDGGTEINFDQQPVQNNGYGKVNQVEVFNNLGDKSTMEFFKKLAVESEKDYQSKQYGHQILDPVSVAIRDYITASGRREQQNAIKTLELKISKAFSSVNKEIMEYEETPGLVHTPEINQNIESLKAVQAKLKLYTDSFNNYFYGNKTLNEKNKNRPQPSEPEDTWLGALTGKWTPTNDKLFPRDPSPNDVKQGFGVEDCFMLSALTKIAETNPQMIRDSMCDNRDGTVSVKFFHKNPESGAMEPVIVDVNKSVKKTLISGSNIYSSSSLWVQMMEKAFAEYNKQYVVQAPGHTAKETKQGMASINRGSTAQFLTAFTGKEYVRNLTFSIPFTAQADGYYGKDGGHPGYYLPEEKELYEFFKTNVNDKKEIMTVGSDNMSTLYTEKELNNMGIRKGHAYTLNKVFTDEATGKMFVQLRDPYAVFCPKYDEKGKLLDDSSPFSGTYKAGIDNMGTFNLEFTDFNRIFNGINFSKECNNEFGAMTRKWRSYENYPLSEGELAGEEFYNKNYKEAAKVQSSENLGFADFDNKETEFEIIGNNELKTEDLGNKESLVEDFGFEELDSDGNAINEINTNAKPQNIELDKDNIIIENSQPDEAEELAKNLTVPDYFTSYKDKLNAAYTDLKCTDQWYVSTNTKKFNDMRDALKDLKNTLNKIKDPSSVTKEQGKAIAKKILDLRNKSDDYIDAKYKSISKEIQDGKSVSTRAMHRIIAATSIQSICSDGEPLSIWNEKKNEQLQIVASDMKQRLSIAEKSPELGLNVDQAAMDNLQKSYAAIKAYMDKNDIPELGENNNAPQQINDAIQEINNEQNLIDDFVMI